MTRSPEGEDEDGMKKRNFILSNLSKCTNFPPNGQS